MVYALTINDKIGALEEQKYVVFNKLKKLIIDNVLKQQDIIKVFSGRNAVCEEVTLLELMGYYIGGYNDCKNESTSKELGVGYNSVCYYFYKLGVSHGNKNLSRIF